jgi:hypothetical protein
LPKRGRCEDVLVAGAPSRTAASRGCVDFGALDDTTGRAWMFNSREQIVQF